jgi:hypothetical protein
MNKRTSGALKPLKGGSRAVEKVKGAAERLDGALRTEKRRRGRWREGRARN